VKTVDSSVVINLRLERQRGVDAGVARALQHLSIVKQLLGLSEEGIQQVKEALGIFERTNNTKEHAECLSNPARLLFDDKQLDAAEDVASRAIGLVSDKGEGHLVCRLHRVLGWIHGSKGDKEKAIHHFKAALAIASPFDWRDILFGNHHDLADLFLGENEFDEASAHIKQAKSHAADGTHLLGCAVYMQARIWYQKRRFEDAKSEVSHALEIFEKLGAMRDAANSRDLLQIVEQAMISRSNGELLENNASSYTY
jgi:tetratricopeptide (TPR) repeat protein